MGNLHQSLIPRSLQRDSQDRPASDTYILLSDFPVTRPTRSHTKKAKDRWHDGHHFGVFCCTITAATVLSINIILAIVGSSHYKVTDGIGILQEGDCAETKRIELWLHLLINILSTLLLGASNYSMQCLSSPTRRDIDEAHRQGSWMDIGVPSTRNVFRISWPRKVLWFLLLCSSFPLHLLYNSVIFSSLSISEWQVFGVGKNFLTGQKFTVDDTEVSSIFGADIIRSGLAQVQNSTSLVRLENGPCINAYAASLVSEWGDLLLVSDYTNSTNSFLGWYSKSRIGDGGDVLYCGGASGCTPDRIPKASHWPLPSALYGPQTDLGLVDHCMATKVQQHCRIRFSLPLMIAVIACNTIKVICLAIIVWKVDPHPLVTIGDAITSFLDSPDPTTIGNCLGGKAEFNKKLTWTAPPLRYHPRKYRWFGSASRNRWLLTVISCVVTLIVAIGLLVMSGITASVKGFNPFTLGFGAVNTNAVLNAGLSHIIAAVLVANSPQLLLSFLYFAYNGLWTCMLLTSEWVSYAKERKPLRVTSPKGGQRSTYRLQLPYRYGIPILAIAGLLHWLVSQSIFLVVLEAYDGEGLFDEEGGLVTCGYSPSAVLTAILTGALVLGLGVANGRRRYEMNGIPLAATCSAAISAACHPPLGDDQASAKAVMWGACESDVTAKGLDSWNLSVGEHGGGGDGDLSVGHCSFTSLDVEKPVPGRLYAGLSSGVDR